MRASGLVSLVMALVFSPLLIGVINRVKAFFAGRRGLPLLQPYRDLSKLFRKGAVYSRTSTWILRAGTAAGLACILAAAALTPFGGLALSGFEGDLILFAGLLALMRFSTVLAALDTGSSFEGMGASREMHFSVLAEPALLLGLTVLAAGTGCLSLGAIYNRLGMELWLKDAPALVLTVLAFSVVFLTENARIPVDDPNTHLELTMIHEVMVLDHSGPDLGIIQYAAALKLWVLGCLIVGILSPLHSGLPWLDCLVSLGGMMLLAVGVGVVESSMARLRLINVPRLLLGAIVFNVLALILILK